MDKKIVLDPNLIQKFKWGGTTQEWAEEAEKLSNQLEAIDYMNKHRNDNSVK